MTVEDLLVCGVCHGALRDVDGSVDIECAACERSYRRSEGAPDLTPIPVPDEALHSKWGLWEKLQENGDRAYRSDPRGSLSVGDRTDAAMFGDFCRLDGTVLDIGCGPQTLPSYACAGRFVGIDPLRGECNRSFDFVQGVGEYLPFRDGTFDHVLFATSLDHMLDPERALREAARTLKPAGTIELWFGEALERPGPVQHALQLLMRGDLRELARGVGNRTGLRRTVAARYPVPQGAADPFHVSHLTQAKIQRMILATGLETLESSCPTPSSHFLRIAPA